MARFSSCSPNTADKVVERSRNASYAGRGIRLSKPMRGRRCPKCTNCSGWLTGNGRRRIASTALKINVVTPMPAASSPAAASVNPRLRDSMRHPIRRSCISALLPRPVVRHGRPDFQRAQVRGAAGEIVVDSRKAHAGVHGGRAGAKLEIEIGGLVQRARIRPRRRHLLKDVVIYDDAVPVLASGLAVLLQRLESPRLARLRFQLPLRLRGKFPGFTRKNRAHRKRRRAPLKRK